MIVLNGKVAGVLGFFCPGKQNNIGTTELFHFTPIFCFILGLFLTCMLNHFSLKYDWLLEKQTKMSLQNKTAKSLVLKTGKMIRLSALCLVSPALSPSCLCVEVCLRLLMKTSAQPRQRCPRGSRCQGLYCALCKAAVELRACGQCWAARQVPSLRPAAADAPSQWERVLALCGRTVYSPRSRCTRQQSCTFRTKSHFYSVCSVLPLKGLAVIRQGGMGHKSQSNSYGMMLCFSSFSLGYSSQLISFIAGVWNGCVPDSC